MKRARLRAAGRGLHARSTCRRTPAPASSSPRCAPVLRLRADLAHVVAGRRRFVGADRRRDRPHLQLQPRLPHSRRRSRARPRTRAPAAARPCLITPDRVRRRLAHERPTAAGSRRQARRASTSTASTTRRTARCSGFWLYLMSDCLIFALPVRRLRRAGPQLCRRARRAPTCSTCRWWRSTPRCCCCRRSPTASRCWRCSAAQAAARCCGWPSPGLLGAGFLGVELYEFAHLIHEGAGPQRSAFLSSFFTLVGTHGLHVTFGIVWLVTLMVQVAQHGLTQREPPPPDVPVDVLALPRRRLDRRLHLRLPDGSAAMSAGRSDSIEHDSHGGGTTTHDDHGDRHAHAQAAT